MKLVFQDWSTPVDFSKKNIQLLNIEDAGYFSEILQELITQQETGSGKFVLSNRDSILDFSKTIEVILSPFILDFSNKKIQNAIIKDFLRIASEEEFLMTREVQGVIQAYLYRLADYLDYDVTIGEMPIIQLLKSAGIQAVKDEDGLLSRLVDYFCLLRKTLNIELFVGVHFKSYFSEGELKLLYKTMTLKGMNLLLLENCSEKEMIEGEQWLTIDKDLCEI